MCNACADRLLFGLRAAVHLLSTYRLSAADRLLVVLTDTGERRDGFPVLKPHSSPEPWSTVLETGYSGRLLRLYALVQRFSRSGTAPQPAYEYLPISKLQGELGR